jgi:K+-transporting ATPase KdpF subunit
VTLRMEAVAAVLAAGLFVYLLIFLLKPEVFE